MTEDSNALDKIQLFVRYLDGTLSLDMNINDTIMKLKNCIYDKSAIPTQFQKLIFDGKLLCNNNQTLKQLKITHLSTIQLPFGISEQKYNSIQLQVNITTTVMKIHSICSKNNIYSKHIIDCNTNKKLSTIISKLQLNHISHCIKFCNPNTGQCFNARQTIGDACKQSNILNITIITDTNWLESSDAWCKSAEISVSDDIKQWVDECQVLNICDTFEQLFDWEIQMQSSMNKLLLQQNECFDKIMSCKQSMKYVQEIFGKSHNDDPAIHKTKIGIITLDKSMEKFAERLILKQTEMTQMLEELVKTKENELLSIYEKWSTDDTIVWLNYLNKFYKCEKNDISLHSKFEKLKTIGINGSNLHQLSDLTLKLIGINDINLRNMFVNEIDNLIQNHGGYLSMKTLCKKQLCLIC
eukprot:62443_1